MKIKNLIDYPNSLTHKNMIWYGTANCSKLDFSVPDTESQLEKMSGSFAVFMEDHSSICLICDSVRSIPLFYSVQGNEIIISNHGVAIANYCHAKINPIARLEFLYTSYVTGNQTLFSDIYTVLPGEIVKISKADGKIHRHFYWEMLYKESVEQSSEADLIDSFDNCLMNVFKDLIARLNGRTALIPLSGGCDSRIVAAMFSRLNYENIICFSYGRQGNPDAIVSKKIADTLHFPWHFIEYNEKVWSSLYTSEIYRKYLAYSCNGTGIGSIRSFPAMMLLQNKVPKDCIVIPGHTLDVLSGSHIPHWGNDRQISLNDFAGEMRKRHYRLYGHPHQAFPLIAKWSESLPEQMDKTRAVQETQYFEWINRQPKFIANEVRKYEFLGYDGWELPFWDFRVCNYVRRLPVAMLQNRYLQYKYMEKIIDPIAGHKQNYIKIQADHTPAQKTKLRIAKAFPFPAHVYHCLKMYKHDDMAFYDHMSLLEYVHWIKQCGVSFNVHSMTTVNGLHVIEELLG